MKNKISLNSNMERKNLGNIMRIWLDFFFFEVGKFSLKVRSLVRGRKRESFLDFCSNNAFQRCRINAGSMHTRPVRGRGNYCLFG